MILHITSHNFSQEVEQSTEPVLLDFWASWCMPCRRMGTVLESFAASHPQARIGKINVDEEPELAARFGVMSIPSLFVLHNGRVIRQAVGLQSTQQLEDLLS